MSNEVPDLAEPILGWRFLTLSPSGSLMGTMGKIWSMDETFTADCNEGCGTTPSPPLHRSWLSRTLRMPSRQTDHLAGMGCGIYAWKPPIEISGHGPKPTISGPSYNDRSFFWSPSVIAATHLWGHVYEHEHGYRAQYGRIVQLCYAVKPWCEVEEAKDFFTLFTEGHPIVKRITFLHVEATQEQIFGSKGN